jgi:hypothetical protein
VLFRSRSVLLTKYYSVDLVEEDEIGEACDTNGGEERYVKDFGGET